MEILIEDNILNQLIMSIYRTYKHNSIAVKIPSEITEWKAINTGVRQGCSLSPLSFITYMNKIIQTWRLTRNGKIPISRNFKTDTMLLQMFRFSLQNLTITITIFSTQFEQYS
jgi:hypothetical protein